MGIEVPFPTTREATVLRELLEVRAAADPDRVFAVFEDGTSWTYGELRAEVVHLARALQRLGVRQGDHVISWQPVGADAIRSWIGINYLGAVYVPFNTAYRGSLLQHVIALSDAKIALVHADLVERFGGLQHHDLRTVVAMGGRSDAPLELTVIDSHEFEAGPRPGGNSPPPEIERPIEVWDTQSIMFTSGTTGPSKAVLSTYRQLSTTANVIYYWLTESDRTLLNLPMFHVAGTTLTTRAIATGGSLAVVKSFNAKEFWKVVRRLGVTYSLMMGSIATFLANLGDDDDRRHTPLKSVMVAPLTKEAIAFAKSIGVDWYTVFNMTELSVPLISARNPEKPGTCGRLRTGAVVRIVDDHDRTLPIGSVGELIVRDDEPWSLSQGYHKNDRATVATWRNGWFHTGDALKCDADGDYFYVDRIKDAIRRRGENISSYEVEREVAEFPGVAEAAAIAVPAKYGEDEVLVVVMPEAGHQIEPRALIDFLVPRMPHYMVPRYVRVMDVLPRTPTMKVEKARLRNEGVTDDAFDREAAGMKVRRQAFKTT